LKFYNNYQVKIAITEHKNIENLKHNTWFFYNIIFSKKLSIGCKIP